MNNFPLLQWNMSGFYNNFEELKLITSRYHPAAIMLQETNLKPDKNASIKNYNIIRKDRLNAERASGGVAILLHESIDYSIINIQTDIEICAIRARFQNLLTLCSIYIPPSASLDINDLNNIIQQIPPPFILAGDFNAHNNLWGSSHTSSRGHIIEDCINTNHLSLLNTNAPTFICSSSGSYSHIDLTLSSLNIVTSYQWEVLNDTYGSDHFPIILKSMSWSQSNYIKTLYNTSKANWSLYQEKFTNPQVNFNNIDSDIANFSNSIHQAAKLSIPENKIFPNRPPVPWWSKDCQRAIRERKTALNRFKRNPTQINFITFKQLKAKAKRTIKEAKRITWRKFVGELNHNSTSQEVWNKIKRLKGRPSRIISGISYNNQWFNNNEDISNAFASYFSFISSDNNCDPDFLNTKISQELNLLNFNSSTEFSYNFPFTLQELKFALSRSRNSAPGPDNVLVPMILNLPESAQYLLLQIYNFIWSSGSLPNTWKESILIPIHKPNKSQSSVESYRPISLTSHLGKVLERMVNFRLMWYLEKHNLIDKEQYGFRKNRSTTDHLVGMEIDIQNSFTKKQHLIAAFLDLSNAFDITWRYDILRTLHNWGIRGNLPIFIKNFLSERSFRVRLGHYESNKHVLENGIPQGSVLSPTLFLIAINSIKQFIPRSICYRLYADDLVIYYSSSNSTIGERQIQTCLYSLDRWAKIHGFKFSPNKSSVTHFCRKRNCPRLNSLSINNSQIPLQESSKFLGLTFDCKLNWKEHLSHVRTKCMKDIRLIKLLSNSSWGSDSESILKIYKSIVRTKIDYGCVAYSSARKSYIKVLDPIQNSCLRLATGAFHTSPIESLQSITGIMSLSHRRLYLLMKYATGLWLKPYISTHLKFFNPVHPLPFYDNPNITLSSNIRFLKFANNNNFSLPPIPPKLSSKFPPWSRINPSYNLELTRHDKNSVNHKIIINDFQSLINDRYKNCKIIYTDGSKSPVYTGSAFYTHLESKNYKLGNFSSVYTAELHAIFEALSYIKVESINDWVIATDSKSVIQSLQRFNHSHPLVNQIHDTLVDLNRHNKIVTFLWIPSHIGIEGNERADTLAKTLSPISCPYIFCKEDIKPIITNTILSIVQLDWDIREGNNKLYEIKPKFFDKFQSFHLSKKDATVLNRISIGHSKLTHEYLLKNEVPPNCETCNTLLTIKHILIDCNKYNNIRNKLNICSNSLQTILKNDLNNFKNIIQFVKEIKLYNKI